MSYSMHTFDGEQMKEIVYQFSKWATAIKIDTWHGNFDEMVKDASMDCKHQLSRKVEDFVKIEVDRDKGEVIGVIHLPYIANEEMKNLQRENSVQFDRILGYQQEMMRFKYKIEHYQKLPWYKRMWTQIR